MGVTATPTAHDPPLDGADVNLYARVWRFVARQLHLRPRAASCPDEREARAAEIPRRRRPRCLSDDRSAELHLSAADAQWGRVAMLRQLEAVHAVDPDERARRRRCYYVGANAGAQAQAAGSARARVQGTCRNCGSLFFRALAGPQAIYCGRDCQSSFEYRRLVQDTADEYALRAVSPGGRGEACCAVEPTAATAIAIAVPRPPPALRLAI